MSSPDQIALLLSRLIAGEGSIPLTISLKDDNEVVALKEQVQALQTRLDALKADYDRTEYLYKCESFLNNRLVDLCRISGIELGPEFFTRPYEYKKTSL